MKKNLLYILPAVALFASCGGGATVDNAALDAKVNALVKNSTEQLKTNCDALVSTTSQMRADSILAVKNAKANMPVAVAKPASPVTPAAKAPAAVTKTPVKTVVKAPVKVTEETKVKDRFSKDPKKAKTEEAKVKNRFGNNTDPKAAKKQVAEEAKKVEKRFVEPTEKEIKAEEKKVLNRFGK
jgi:hypothetical protein